MATDNNSLEVDPICIEYPSYDDNVNEIIIDALKQENRQVHLKLYFNSDLFNQSEEIREAILLASKKNTGLLTKVLCLNDCTKGRYKLCLEFYCKLLEGGCNNHNYNHNHGAGVEDFSIATIKDTVVRLH